MLQWFLTRPENTNRRKEDWIATTSSAEAFKHLSARCPLLFVPPGRFKIVDFQDYGCDYCKPHISADFKALPSLKNLSSSEMWRMVAANGFEVVSVKYGTPPKYPVVCLHWSVYSPMSCSLVEYIQRASVVVVPIMALMMFAPSTSVALSHTNWHCIYTLHTSGTH